MITNKSTSDSAFKWAELNTPEQAAVTANQLLCFLAECNMRDGAIWLHRGWAKIWERILENAEDEKTNTAA